MSHHLHILTTIALGWSTATCLMAQSDRAPVEPRSLPAPDQVIEPADQPVVEKIDDTHYRIGLITIDKSTREIRIPAVVNLDDGLLEFLLVHETGKTHEALFSTKASPTHLNIAFKLLRYMPSPEMQPLTNDHGQNTGQCPDVSPDTKAAARVAIRVTWQQDGKTHDLPVNELVQHRVKTTSMPLGPWVYYGSTMVDAGYAPEVSGDMIDIYTTGSAILNYPGEGHDDDEIWMPYPKRVPAVGTAATLILRPWPTKSLSDPPPTQKP